jgi:hypothetical protein
MTRNSFLIVAKELAADKRISVTAKLLLAQLVDHRNGRTGQCNPRETTLAAELGICKRTVKYRLAELKRAGLIEVKRTQHGNHYKFPGAKDCPSQGQDRPLRRGKSCPSGAPYPLYESYVIEPAAKECASDAAAAVQPKPPASANRDEHTVSIVRQSLQELAREIHMRPPDEDLVRRVIDAARGAPGDVIHETLVSFWKRGRLSTIRSWGLLLTLLNGCFEDEPQPACSGR